MFRVFTNNSKAIFIWNIKDDVLEFLINFLYLLGILVCFFNLEKELSAINTF